MTVVTIKRIDGLLELARANLPRQVQSSGNFDDWNVVAPALVAIAVDLFERMVGLAPPRGRVVAEILGRSLSEYVITFAWLAALTDEQRQNALNSVVKAEFLERERAENKLRDQIAGRPGYEHLFDAETRPGGALPANLLDEVTRARLVELKADESVSLPPNAFDMAFAADRRWIGEIDLVEHNPFAMVYFVLFVGPSFMTHPSVTSVARMTLGNPPNLVVGAPEPLGISESPYGQSLIALANMLMVSSRVLGWPDEEVLREVLDRG